jgi:hypothetical protein
MLQTYQPSRRSVRNRPRWFLSEMRRRESQRGDMRICFIPKTFYGKNTALLQNCDAVCTTFFEKGYSLTLRQLFYQLVSTNRIANTVKAYESLGVLVSEGRYAGLLDWEHITDRVRVLQDSPRWADAKERLEGATNMRIDTLQEQKYRPEVWIEKDALIELARNVCVPWDVPYIAVKAYSSTSAIWEAYKRFVGYLAAGQKPLILHLGDLDCTGDDCSRHLQERMSLMCGCPVELRRLALNPAQVEHYELPPQPGKTADPRFKGYQLKYGTDSVWELDALQPEVIEGLIEDGISEAIDTERRGGFLTIQAGYQAGIARLAENYDALATDGFDAYTQIAKGVVSNGFSPAPRSKSGIPRFQGVGQEMDAATAAEYAARLNG